MPIEQLVATLPVTLQSPSAPIAEKVNLDQMRDYIERSGMRLFNVEQLFGNPLSDELSRTFSNREIKGFIAETKIQLAGLERTCLEQPYSFNEYFFFAAWRALRALTEGNYGIGATFVKRDRHKETVIVAGNEIVSKNDPGAHAEQELINAAASIGRGEKTYKRRLIRRRNRPGNDDPYQQTEKIVATTIESCAGCYTVLITSKVSKIWSCWPDRSGILHQPNAQLPFWDEIAQAQGLRATLVYDKINPQLSEIIWNTFAINRHVLDEQLERQGLSRELKFERTAARIWNGR